MKKESVRLRDAIMSAKKYAIELVAPPKKEQNVSVIYHDRLPEVRTTHGRDYLSGQIGLQKYLHIERQKLRS